LASGLATSGGGPYALACAVLMPDRVQAVILASALGRVGGEGDLDLLPEDIAEEWRDPEGARDRLEAEVAELRADPLAGLRQLTSDWPAEERDWLEEHSGAVAGNMAEATRQGAAGWWLDGQACGRPWPFDVAAIRAPIHVFHGDSDGLAPLPVLRRSLARAAHVREDRIYPGGNHGSPNATRERQAAMLAVVTG
jgi:pimeloyl-ACP methyl ester carboxylesterase